MEQKTTKRKKGILITIFDKILSCGFPQRRHESVGKNFPHHDFKIFRRFDFKNGFWIKVY